MTQTLLNLLYALIAWLEARQLGMESEKLKEDKRIQDEIKIAQEASDAVSALSDDAVAAELLKWRQHTDSGSLLN